MKKPFWPVLALAALTAGAASPALDEASLVRTLLQHHQDAIVMARLEQDRGASSAVKRLAARIRASQEKEVGELRAAERALASAPGSAASDPLGEESQAALMRLKSLEAPELDLAFLEETSRLHRRAIELAEGAKLASPELKQLVKKMVSGQKKALEELERLAAVQRGS
jgi:uncharacterized protein (DUF305 family)